MRFLDFRLAGADVEPMSETHYLFWQASFSLLRLVTTPYIYPETRQPPASGHSQAAWQVSWFIRHEHSPGRILTL